MSVNTQVTARFAQAIAAQVADQNGTIGLAVSGGGDSIALMHLAARALPSHRLQVLSVDHGLRADAADEIEHVATQARALGLTHHVSKWTWDGTGNLQAAARAGRWASLCDLSKHHGIAQIWTGHTPDDQVETFLMRLARGSGVDGLAAMKRASVRDGVPVLRPLLDLSRADLRDWLTEQKIGWCEDPSNDDTRYDRIRARRMGEALADLGLTPRRILRTVDHMNAAQTTLEQAAHDFSLVHIRQDKGDLVVSADGLANMQSDTARRVFAAALGWVGGHAHRPRFDQLIAAAKAVLHGDTTTLAGCILTPSKDGNIRIQREASKTPEIAMTGDDSCIVWDGRWQMVGPFVAGMTIKALGDAVKDCPDWRETGTPRASLLGSPSVWHKGKLVSAPLADFGNGWSAQIVANFHSSAFAIED